MAIAVTALAAGCGEDSTPDADVGATSLSQADFVEQADAICRETFETTVAEAVSRLQEEAAQPNANQRAVEARIAEEVLFPALRDDIEQVRALGAPKSIAPRVERMLRESEAVIGKLEAKPGRLANEAEPFAEPEAEAERIGLSACPYGE